jgi:uncharacterized membrane protein YkoI
MKMRAPPLALLAALICAGPTLRAQDAPRVPAHSVTLAAASLSLEQAVRLAEQQFKARVVRAEAQHEGDRTIYVLRMLNESGRVWTVRVDASSGSVL